MILSSYTDTELTGLNSVLDSFTVDLLSDGSLRVNFKQGVGVRYVQRDIDILLAIDIVTSRVHLKVSSVIAFYIEYPFDKLPLLSSCGDRIGTNIITYRLMIGK